MGSYKVMHAFDVRLPLRLKGWKVAVAIGAAIILAPVVGLVLLVLVGTLLPVLPLLATLFLRLWLVSQHSALPSARIRPPVALRPPMSHPSIY
jgi:hypothetical protein